MESEIIMVLEW